MGRLGQANEYAQGRDIVHQYAHPEALSNEEMGTCVLSVSMLQHFPLCVNVCSIELCGLMQPWCSEGTCMYLSGVLWSR